MEISGITQTQRKKKIVRIGIAWKKRKKETDKKR